MRTTRWWINGTDEKGNRLWPGVPEEYQERFSAKRVSNLAAAIRAADEHHHAIAVHKLSGLDFREFAEDPNLNQFATQYVLARPGDAYIAYSAAATGPLGLKTMAAGVYDFTWLDCATGKTLREPGRERGIAHRGSPSRCRGHPQVHTQARPHAPLRTSLDLTRRLGGAGGAGLDLGRGRDAGGPETVAAMAGRAGPGTATRWIPMPTTSRRS